MSVYKSKRGESSVQLIETARQLEAHTLACCMKAPKRYSFLLTQLPQPSAETQIESLKQQLANTDYKAIKYAEGLITAEDYAAAKAQRQAWRDDINKLELDDSDGQ